MQPHNQINHILITSTYFNWYQE